jgi:hypothetical protein
MQSLDTPAMTKGLSTVLPSNTLDSMDFAQNQQRRKSILKPTAQSSVDAKPRPKQSTFVIFSDKEESSSSSYDSHSDNGAPYQERYGRAMHQMAQNLNDDVNDEELKSRSGEQPRKKRGGVRRALRRNQEVLMTMVAEMKTMGAAIQTMGAQIVNIETKLK